MFVGVKKSGAYEYLQIVHNQRIDGVGIEGVPATGRRDAGCDASGGLRTTRRRSPRSPVGVRQALGRTRPTASSPHPAPGSQVRVLRGTCRVDDRAPSADGFRSDRAAERWCRGYALSGIEDLELHHLYRAMGWLGEPLPAAEQSADQRLGPRCRKDLIEERWASTVTTSFTGHVKSAKFLSSEGRRSLCGASALRGVPQRGTSRQGPA